MANATVQNIGQVNQAGDTRALFLKLFSGEVLTSFEKHCVMLDKHSVRTISNGKSAQFPVIGRMPDAAYHAAGAEIVGQNIAHAEKVLTVDGLLINHVFIPDIDEAMAHFDVRSKYSHMMGQKLSQTFDAHVMRETILAARAAAAITGEDGGFTIADDGLKNAVDATRATAFIDAMYDCAINFDNKFITGERYAILKPADYRFLAKYVSSAGFSVVNRDYSPDNGSFAAGDVLELAGIKLISSPMLPVADSTGDTYHGVDSRLTKALVFTPDAVGTVKLMDLSLQSEWDIRRQGTLMVARYAMGHGILQPECACDVATAT